MAGELRRLSVMKSAAGAVSITCVTTFLLNTVLLSGSSTCAIVWPLFGPLLLELGLSGTIATAAVLGGAWGGFLNPADTGGVMIRQASHGYPITLMHIMPALVGMGIIVVCLIRWANRERRASGSEIPELRSLAPGISKSGWVGAIVVLLPLALMIVFEVLRALGLLDLPREQCFLIGMSLATIAAIAAPSEANKERSDLERARGSRGAESRAVAIFKSVWDAALGALGGFQDVILLVATSQIFAAAIFACLGLNSAVGATDFLLLAAVPAAFALTMLIGSGDAVVAPVVHMTIPANAQCYSLTGAVLGSMIWLACELARCATPLSSAVAMTAFGLKASRRLVLWRLLPILLVAMVMACATLCLTAILLR
jgi:hypothetical protein